jgi:hypothetical protein
MKTALIIIALEYVTGSLLVAIILPTFNRKEKRVSLG